MKLSAINATPKFANRAALFVFHKGPKTIKHLINLCPPEVRAITWRQRLGTTLVASYSIQLAPQGGYGPRSHFESVRHEYAATSRHSLKDKVEHYCRGSITHLCIIIQKGGES